ncbi:MAG: copper chaperone NosL [Arcticibacterium sp.]|jgi:copper chaperone NosL
MKKSKVLMLVGVLLLGALFVLPLWNISLEAPQYPDAIGMNIHINKIVDMNPNDIKNINIMNHYVGMKDIPDMLPEFKIFPYVVIGMMLLGLLIGLKLNYKWYLVWFILMCLVGAAGMYDFYLWEYDYGHTLRENAAIKFKNPDGTPLAYQPPLLGTKTILNFVAHSYPRSGAYLLFTGMFMAFVAFFIGKKEATK